MLKSAYLIVKSLKAFYLSTFHVFFLQMIAFKSQKRQRDQQRKQKITENRKHLANVRVVQKNLVFVVGLPPRLADADVSN